MLREGFSTSSVQLVVMVGLVTSTSVILFFKIKNNIDYLQHGKFHIAWLFTLAAVGVWVFNNHLRSEQFTKNMNEQLSTMNRTDAEVSQMARQDFSQLAIGTKERQELFTFCQENYSKHPPAASNLEPQAYCRCFAVHVDHYVYPILPEDCRNLTGLRERSLRCNRNGLQYYGYMAGVERKCVEWASTK
jgi:hypothetical protein